jgi:DNA-binding IclR family transcriptional regulator
MKNDLSGHDGAQSITRAGRLILAVAEAGEMGVRLTELAAGLNLPHPTVHRMLNALCRVGVLKRMDRSNRYFLGRALVQRPDTAVPMEVLQRVARPSLVRLATRVMDNVFLSVREEYEAVCVDRMEGQFPIRYGLLDVGVRRPLGVGAASLALLAALPDDAVEDGLRVNREVLKGPHAPVRLRELVEETRYNGYAFDNGRLFAGGCGLGMTIRTPGGGLVGAVSIGAIAERMTGGRLTELVEALRFEVSSIAQALTARAQLSGAGS